MKNRNHRIERSGTVLLVVLVCMVVTTSIVLGAVQSSLRHRRQLRQDIQMEQTRWLLDAGIGRAISQLERDADYDGETINDILLAEKYKCVVEIQQLDSTDQQKFRVVAQTMAGENLPSMQRSKTIVIERQARDE